MLKAIYGKVICNLNVYQISSIQALYIFQHPYIQETRKIDT